MWRIFSYYWQSQIKLVQGVAYSPKIGTEKMSVSGLMYNQLCVNMWVIQAYNTTRCIRSSSGKRGKIRQGGKACHLSLEESTSGAIQHAKKPDLATDRVRRVIILAIIHNLSLCWHHICFTAAYKCVCLACISYSKVCTTGSKVFMTWVKNRGWPNEFKVLATC